MSSTFSSDETAPSYGFLGAAAALVFCYKTHRISHFLTCFLFFLENQEQSEWKWRLSLLFAAGMGAAYGTAKSGVGVASWGWCDWARDAVDSAGRHGRSVGDQRLDHRRHHQYWNQSQGQVSQSFWWPRALVFWPRLWPRRPLRRYGHWDRRRCRSSVWSFNTCSLLLSFCFFPHWNWMIISVLISTGFCLID